MLGAESLDLWVPDRVSSTRGHRSCQHHKQPNQIQPRTCLSLLFEMQGRAAAVCLAILLAADRASSFAPVTAPLPTSPGARSRLAVVRLPPPRLHACIGRKGTSCNARPTEGGGADRDAPAGMRTWAPKSGKPTLVILIGFLGCTESIMAKYSRVYREAGTESVVEILPSIASMLLAHQGWRGGGSRSVRQVCDLIEHRASDAEIIVHLFSNNGFVFFGSCLLAQPGLSKLVSAVILDSAPCYITSDVAATGLISATQRVEAAAAGKRRLRKVIKAGVWPLVRVLDRRQAAVWRAWQQHCPAAPHLFLYSAADGVVPPAEIETFAETHCARLRMLGVASHLSRWDTAPHCGDDLCCVCVLALRSCCCRY